MVKISVLSVALVSVRFVIKAIRDPPPPPGIGVGNGLGDGLGVGVGIGVPSGVGVDIGEPDGVCVGPGGVAACVGVGMGIVPITRPPLLSLLPPPPYPSGSPSRSPDTTVIPIAVSG